MAKTMISDKYSLLEDLVKSSKALIVIILGPPGSGKGTHAPAIANHLQIPHISTGDLLRENIRNQTPIGQKAKSFMDQGCLVPDEVVLDMLFARLSMPDSAKGAVLDGVPRTLDQAEAIYDKLHFSHHFQVLLLKIDTHLLIERICGRIACKNCGRPYHKVYAPPKKDLLCDMCQTPLHQRSDDTEEILQKRLEVYKNQTEPLIEYYQKIPDTLSEINSNQPKENVLKDIFKTLDIFACNINHCIQYPY
jgi:adenylate kinase